MLAVAQMVAAFAICRGTSVTSRSEPESPGYAGDTQVARDISNLRDKRVLGGGTTTFDDAWGQLAFQVGSHAATAIVELAGRAEAARQSAAAWDAVSAVSLDEEALQITRFQAAYEANAVMFRTINDTIDTLMRMMGVV